MVRDDSLGLKLTGATEVGSFAAERLEGLLRRLAYQIGRAAQSPHVTEVHDLRVAIRRFMQALTCLGPCFCNKAIKKIGRRLEKIMEPAREVRNCDIAIEMLSQSKTSRLTLLSSFRKQRKERERDLVRALRRWSQRGWYSTWRAELEPGGHGGENRLPIGATAERTLGPMLQRFLGRGRRLLGSETPLNKAHRLRIAAKKVRYALELFEPVYGAALKTWLERMKALQDVLGAISDCETVRVMIDAQGGDARFESVLRRRALRKIEEFRRIWTDSFTDGSIRSLIDQIDREVPRKPETRSASRTPETVLPQAAHA